VPRQISVDRFAASVLGRKGLTEFIKSTSGAQVTDKERAFLETVFPSLEQGALTRAQLKIAISIFRKGTILGLAQDIQFAKLRGTKKEAELLEKRILSLAKPLGLKAKNTDEIIEELSANDLTEGLGSISTISTTRRGPATAPRATTPSFIRRSR